VGEVSPRGRAVAAVVGGLPRRPLVEEYHLDKKEQPLCLQDHRFRLRLRSPL
jgi:hypothetical protein